MAKTDYTLDQDLGEWRDIGICQIALSQNADGHHWHVLGQFEFGEIRKIETFRSREDAGAAYWALVSLGNVVRCDARLPAR